MPATSVTLPSPAAAQQHGHGAGGLAQLIDQLPHRVGVGVGRFGHDDPHAADLAGVGQQPFGRDAAGSRGVAASCFFKSRSSLTTAATRSGTSVAGTRNMAAVSASAVSCSRTRSSAAVPVKAVIAARAGRHALLADDLEQADLAAVVQVRAAAQLLAELADRDHPHDVRILLAKEHHRAGLAGLGQRQAAPTDLGARGHQLD